MDIKYEEAEVNNLGQPEWRWVDVRPGIVFNRCPVRINGTWYRWATNVTDPRSDKETRGVRDNARRYIDSGLRKGGILCRAANPVDWSNAKTDAELPMLSIMLPCTAEGKFTVSRSFN
jgi:hypothetical protein